MKTKMKPTIKPTKGDFDRAREGKWNATTCVVAQLMIRKGISPTTGLDIRRDPTDPFNVARVNGLRLIQSEFDQLSTPAVPKTEQERRFATLRKSLPRFNWPWQKLITPTDSLHSKYEDHKII